MMDENNLYADATYINHPPIYLQGHGGGGGSPCGHGNQTPCVPFKGEIFLICAAVILGIIKLKINYIMKKIRFVKFKIHALCK